MRGDPDHPANFGRLCSKGSTLHLTATDAVRRHDRLLQPQWRADRGERAAGAALGRRARPPRRPLCRDRSREHGPDAVAFYVSGQLLTEDYYVFNKLAKGLIGTNNIDTNSRLCMSSAVAGYKQSLGADAPPACYDDIDLRRLPLHRRLEHRVGAPDPVPPHRGCEARRGPSMKIVVVDPRRTATAEFADLHLQIQPGTDVALFNGMLHAMIWDGPDRPPLHRRPHQRLRRAEDAGPRHAAARGGAHLRRAGRGDPAGGRLVRRVAGDACRCGARA